MPTLKQYNIINCYIYYTLALKMALDADRVLNLHSNSKYIYYTDCDGFKFHFT